MSCQETIKLGLLHEEDAVNLFLHHATENGKDCPNKLKLLASKVVIECGNLPVVIVAVARTFRNWDPNEWEDAFAVIEKDSSLRHGNIDEEVKKFYNSLKISFKCLDRGAQDLILLCSIFSRAYEIPVEVLSRIAIGSRLSENVGSYYRARSEVLSIKTTLIRSALLLTTREGFVKMHDVIRDIAHQIGDEKIQVITDSKSKLKENVKYSSWMIDDFSNSFEGINLEVLLVWVNNASHPLGVPEAFFGGMKGLRVLLLCSKVKFRRTLALSLPKSIHSLENIQTLSLTNWELGDISILQNLKKLQTLELTNCSISELPNEVSQQEKLRLLGLVDCSIEKNNCWLDSSCSNVVYFSSGTTSVWFFSSCCPLVGSFLLTSIEGGDRVILREGGDLYPISNPKNQR
ncbi:probable disease resistance protein At4g27220 [Neltuma alba]|uniref:probable disease resistance protein At4g27220 n=1 Tax=Neltuma alba TaxID=207710 RepID=UPI0010A49F9D|nr:probable disease resistance protein At4g27220 [Prosopis alba]